MKRVGILKKKVSGYALHTQGGELKTGYVGSHTLQGKPDVMQKKVDEAKAALISHPVKPTPPVRDWPSYKTDPVGYDHYRDQMNFCHLWDQWQKRVECEVICARTIFEDTLVFIGYRKGQSSFVLKFVASDGSMIEFGPSATGSLVENLITGTHVKIVDVVDHKSEKQFKPDPAKPNNWIRDSEGRCLEFETFFTGKAIHLQFYLTKQGQNIYANVYTGVE